MEPKLIDDGYGPEWVDLDSPQSDDPDDGYEGLSDTDVASYLTRLHEELKAHRKYLETVTDNGTDYGEDWDVLQDLGLIKTAPPTQEFIDEWGDDAEMWVLAWQGGE